MEMNEGQAERERERRGNERQASESSATARSAAGLVAAEAEALDRLTDVTSALLSRRDTRYSDPMWTLRTHITYILLTSSALSFRYRQVRTGWSRAFHRDVQS